MLNWSSEARPAAANIGYTNSAMWLVFCYIWLPFMIIPVYAALERIPDSLHRGVARPRRAELPDAPAVLLPLALPGVVAGSIFTFSLTLGDYITPLLVGGASANSSATSSTTSAREQPAVRRRLGPRAARDHGPLPARRAGARRVRGAVMERAAARIVLGVWVALVLAFLFVPIVLICLYAFNQSNMQSWPIAGLTTKWFSPAWHDGGRAATRSWLSLKAALLATASRSCSARPRRSACTGSGSSAARRSRSCSCCRSRCPGSSPASR